jgi:hypothetical protein
MFQFIKADISDSILRFSEGFQDMKMESPELNLPFIKPLHDGHGEGSHPSFQEMIVVGLNNEVDVIRLHRIVQNPKSLFSRVENRPFQDAEEILVPDGRLIFDIDVGWRVAGNLFSFPV